MFLNKLYYPSLPIDGISAKEAIAKLKESDNKIAEIAVEGDSIWYITSSENKGILLHFYQVEGEHWNNQILFRNYLRSNPDVSKEYHQ
ncbi:GrpB family protein [Bacillus solitudinis]|uniref:GrpB family protein n=1 Tax=Bacillus solitudinis TaxID=2014074 RepID=UPI000C2460D3|nr:GrpB family protein [Bacillus solitudinis]